MILDETLTLSNGVAMPKLGLGTWMIPNDTVGAAVVDAIELGYRHIDTAQAYGNEQGVGAGIQQSGIDRDALFVTTKLAAELKDEAAAAAAIDGSLAALGLDHIDLMLIHSPWPWRQYGEDDRHFAGNRAAWRALQAALAAGKLRAIGVSNFHAVDIQNLVDAGGPAPMVNQVLAHIGAVPTALIADCHARGMAVQAYSPIAHGMLLQDPTLGEMAARYGVSIAQLSIRFDLQLGLAPVPKTARRAHMAANAAVDFEISAADMETLSAMPPLENYGEASMMPVFGGKLP